MKSRKTLVLMTQSVKLKNDLVLINPRQLFNRILCVANTPSQLEKCFHFELTPEPVALFKDSRIRKTDKSVLMKFFESYCPSIVELPDKNESMFCIDGGI